MRLSFFKMNSKEIEKQNFKLLTHLTQENPQTFYMHFDQKSFVFFMHIRPMTYMTLTGIYNMELKIFLAINQRQLRGSLCIEK